ncbi:MAG: hypothetical protein DRJ97_05815 [Thermoprotei archaeon]|nr:MAG: hypothetical protein DRJ97_05815 [Thermoprotei archaeon]
MGRSRGVSEVVASLLLLGVVIALSVLILTYSLGAFQLAQTSMSRRFFEEGQSLREQFVIVDVWYHDGELSVAVYNCGDTDAVVAGLYVNETLTATPRVELLRGEMKWINASFQAEENATYWVKISTERGNTYETLWKA